MKNHKDYDSYYKKMDRYTYGNRYYPNPVTRYNKYWNGKRTTEAFTTYYKPEDFYNPEGYFSYRFGRIYYDGYGYNFYTGKYGYYEFSLNLEQYRPDYVIATVALAVSLVFCMGCTTRSFVGKVKLL